MQRHSKRLLRLGCCAEERHVHATKCRAGARGAQAAGRRADNGSLTGRVGKRRHIADGAKGQPAVAAAGNAPRASAEVGVVAAKEQNVSRRRRSLDSECRVQVAGRREGVSSGAWTWDVGMSRERSVRQHSCRSVPDSACSFFLHSFHHHLSSLLSGTLTSVIWGSLQ